MNSCCKKTALECEHIWLDDFRTTEVGRYCYKCGTKWEAKCSATTEVNQR